jgi:hypothetical protein
MITRTSILSALLLGLTWVFWMPDKVTVAGDNAATANAMSRLKAARKVYKLQMELLINVPGQRDSAEKIYSWSRRWMEAQRDLSPDRKKRVAAAEGHLARMQKLEKLLNDFVKLGGEESYRYEAFMANYFRLEAEKWLAQARKSKKK